jgi:hypothetical protein
MADTRPKATPTFNPTPIPQQTGVSGNGGEANLMIFLC